MDSGGYSYIVSLKLALHTLTPIKVPGYSPKLVKTLIYLTPGLELVRKLYELREPLKPFSITPLLRDGKALISDRPIAIPRNEVLEFRISIAINDPNTLDLFSSIDTVTEIAPGRKVRVSLQEIEIVSADSLSIGFTGRELIRFRFLSPVLLSTKLMAPPLPHFLSRVRNVKEKYVLYPSASHICCYLAKLWNRLFPSKPISRKYSSEWASYFMGRLCGVIMIPIDLNIKPITIVYDRNRKPRGFTGWTLYEVCTNDKRIIERLDKLFALAKYMGIGKSRSIGFGTTTIETIPRKE